MLGAGLGPFGCANGGTGTSKPIEPSRAIEDRPVLPQWRQFALERYQQAVLANMKAAAQFKNEPQVIAEYDPNSNETLITVTGEVDEQEPSNGLSRLAFAVSWRQTGDLAKAGSRFSEETVSGLYIWPLKQEVAGEPRAN
jgi:hypothetical protein